MTTKILFLDRDGVINHDPEDYTKNLSELTLLPNATKAVAYATSLGYTIVVITNQAGVGKGLYTHQNVVEIHQYIAQKAEEAGGEIAAFYYCPHNPNATKCLCRKPDHIMVQKALARYNASPSQSLFIGDKPRDVACAEAAGVKGILMPCNGDLLYILTQNLPK